MAKFINTRKAVSELEDLIRGAGERLILISPFLKLSKDFRQLLEYRNGKDKVTTIVFGKQELKPDEMRFLQGLQFVVLKYNEDLHAKCYVSDDKMIITSLNLYEFSMANNKEMGVLIDRVDASDAQLFQDAMSEVDFIQSTSQRFDFAAAPPALAPALPERVVASSVGRKESSLPTQRTASHHVGFCIRTGVEIPFNIEKPLSYSAYKEWKYDGDPDESENFCHFSGESSDGETSVRRPILRKNWKKAQSFEGA